MKNQDPKKAFSPSVSPTQLWATGASFYATEADKFRLTGLCRDLVIGRGSMIVERFRQSLEESGGGIEEVADSLETIRKHAQALAGQFHDLIELEASWIQTIYPSTEILLYFWTRAKRAKENKSEAALNIQREFHLRIAAIIAIVIGRLLPQDKARAKLASVKKMFALGLAQIITDRVGSLLSGLPFVAVDFREPSSNLAAVLALENAIEFIPDSKLPVFSFEVGIFECVEKYFGLGLSHPDSHPAFGDILLLEPFKNIENFVTTYGLVALGLFV